MSTKLARAVLMFYKPGRWTDEDAKAWLDLTGYEDVTTKALGDMARAEVEEARSPEPAAKPTAPPTNPESRQVAEMILAVALERLGPERLLGVSKRSGVWIVRDMQSSECWLVQQFSAGGEFAFIAQTARPAGV